MNPVVALILIALALVVGFFAGVLLAQWRVDLGSPGAMLIARERRRQKAVKGFTVDHDRLHMTTLGLGYLANAGAAYAIRGVNGNMAAAKFLYPFGEGMPPAKSREGAPAPIVDLVKAGALIAAEIDLQERLSTDFEARRAKSLNDGKVAGYQMPEAPGAH